MSSFFALSPKTVRTIDITMKYKILEDSPKNFSFQINYKDEQIVSIIVSVIGVSIVVLTLLNVSSFIIPKVILPKDLVTFNFFTYLVGLIILAYGIFKSLILSEVATCSINTISQQLSIRKRSLYGSYIQEYRLDDVMGFEVVAVNSKSSGAELIAWLKKSNQIRGTKVIIGQGYFILKRDLRSFKPCPALR